MRFYVSGSNLVLMILVTAINFHSSSYEFTNTSHAADRCSAASKCSPTFAYGVTELGMVLSGG